MMSHILVPQGRLNELMSQLRMQTQVPGARADQQCMLDPMLLDEIRQVSPASLSGLGSTVIGKWNFLHSGHIFGPNTIRTNKKCPD